MGSTSTNMTAQQAQAATSSYASMANEQQIFVANAFRGQPYLVDQLDVQDEPLYDTLTYNPGDTVTVNSAQWFTSVGPQSGKSLVQTNLTETRHLVAPEAFSVFGIRLEPNANVLAADWLAIVQGFVFQFWLNSKSYNTGPIDHYAAGAGTFAVSDRSSESWYANGFPSIPSGHLLALPLVITNLLSFWGQLVGNNYQLSAGGTGLLFLCKLVGLHARAVQ